MFSALEQLLLPAECLSCRGLLPWTQSDALVCPACRTRWRALRPPWCERCGQPEPHFGPCRLCPEWPPALRRARSAVWLDSEAREAVHALKYRGLPRVAADLAARMVRVLPRPIPPATLIPVPLGPRRLRERGYNQSEHLAAALGRHWRLPVRPDPLVRRLDTATQTALTPTARLANVAGAFAGRNVPRSPVILVDDVFTTGATLAEAARALAAAGAREIAAVTFGRAVIPDFT